MACRGQTCRVPRIEPNPFRIAGELLPFEMIDRDEAAARLRSLAAGGHSSRLVAPRRYGKTSLLRRVLADASAEGWATALVHLEGVLSLSSVVVRIERAYDRELKGAIRRTVDALFRAWQVGLSLGAGGFTATLQSNPRVDVESVLLRLLDLPTKLHERTGARSLVAFDEFHDLLRVDGADGILRSVLQHQTSVASYAFSGSAPPEEGKRRPRARRSAREGRSAQDALGPGAHRPAARALAGRARALLTLRDNISLWTRGNWLLSARSSSGGASRRRPSGWG
jgi:hypothetical protein